MADINAFLQCFCKIFECFDLCMRCGQCINLYCDKDPLISSDAHSVVEDNHENQSVEGDNHNGSDFVAKGPPFASVNLNDAEIITSQPKRSDVEIVFGIDHENELTSPPKYESLDDKHSLNTRK
ncbi:hypothetical protein ACKWTF_013409 [Chironomus riparius]